MHIIPAINAASFEQAREQLAKVAAFAPMVHLDIADGTFTKNKLWGSPEEVSSLVASGQWLVAHFEVHLMVSKPEDVVEPWLAAGARRVIAHVETISDPNRILTACAAHRAQGVAAIVFNTPPERLEPFLADWQAFQVLSVVPGKAGQAFQNEAVDKVRFMRERAPRATIEVDGGINLETARLCKTAGADTLVSAHYLLGSSDPRKAYEELTNI